MTTMRIATTRIGDRVTCATATRPYSSSSVDYDGRMFTPGMVGSVVAHPPSVRAPKCANCGRRHPTFALVEFQWDDCATDRTAILACNVRHT